MPKIVQHCLAFAVGMTLVPVAVARSTDCPELARPLARPGYSIHIDTTNTIRKLTPEFFGFNLEWVEFQLSLWDASNRRVNPDAVEWLKAFPGAVYRYPGGTVANYFDWRMATGSFASRKPQRAVTWREALTAEFGPREYLDFVDAVGGRPWYVLNLYGTLAGELAPPALTKEAADLATFFRQETTSGRPAIYRWELGNELDRDRFMWRPEKYVEVATQIMSSVEAADKNARFVAMSQDWNASKEKYGIDAITYNSVLGKALNGKVSEFASHHYYDGRPWGPPVPLQVRQHCRNLNALERSGAQSPSIWVTEHGRTPKGTPADSDWKSNWPQSADLSAAISVADMVIALASDPAVKGQFLHALHATDGPWPLFHRSKDGRIVPSAVYWGLRTLRESMQTDVLSTRVGSAKRSQFEGGYDLRAVAMTDAKRGQISIWLANRAEASIQVSLKIPALASVARQAMVAMLDSADPSVNNYGGVTRIRTRSETQALAFDRDGNATLRVPASAVMSISFPGPGDGK